MREVQRHNFEFLRTEILKLPIEDFADKIGVSKSSYQRMKSQNYDAEYYFSPIQKACELADISLDVFSTQYLTKELYNNRHKKTQVIVLSKKQLLAFFISGIIIFCMLFGIIAKQISHANQVPSANILSEGEDATSIMHESKRIYYWVSKEGGSYHIKRNCPIIKNRNNVESGTFDEALEKKKFDPCDLCVMQ